MRTYMRARCVKVAPKCKQLPVKQVHMDMSQRNLHMGIDQTEGHRFPAGEH